MFHSMIELEKQKHNGRVGDKGADINHLLKTAQMRVFSKLIRSNQYKSNFYRVRLSLINEFNLFAVL